MVTLYYYHDPMCSWCWGYRPVADQLFARLPAGVTLVNVLGGLAPDSDEPMPEELRQAIPGYWKNIEELLGTEFNYDFWTECEPRRSTYPACRAVIAAALQEREEAMTDAIQRAYYLRAMNPSNLSTLETLAAELELDTGQFATDIRSPQVEAELQRQIQFSRQSPIRGFPSLVLEQDGELIPVQQDYHSAQVSLDHLQELMQN
jgi:putative protein-disulfide isomerase